MAGLRVLTLGVGDAFSAKYYSTCFALESAGRWLLVDCPHPIRKILREAAESAGISLQADQLEAVYLTHLHGDHVSGLEVLGYYFRYVVGRRLPVYTHRDVAAHLWDGVLAGSMEWAYEQPGAAPVQRSLGEFFELRFSRNTCRLPSGRSASCAARTSTACRRSPSSARPGGARSATAPTRSSIPNYWSGWRRPI